MHGTNAGAHADASSAAQRNSGGEDGLLQQPEVAASLAKAKANLQGGYAVDARSNHAGVGGAVGGPAALGPAALGPAAAEASLHRSATATPWLREASTEDNVYDALARPSEEYRKQTEALLQLMADSGDVIAQQWRKTLEEQAPGLPPSGGRRARSVPPLDVSVARALHDLLLTLVKDRDLDVLACFQGTLATMPLEQCLELKRGLTSYPKVVVKCAGGQPYFQPHWLFDVGKRLEAACVRVRAAVGTFVEQRFKVSQGLVKRKSEAADALRGGGSAHGSGSVRGSVRSRRGDLYRASSLQSDNDALNRAKTAAAALAARDTRAFRTGGSGSYNTALGGQDGHGTPLATLLTTVVDVTRHLSTHMEEMAADRRLLTRMLEERGLLSGTSGTSGETVQEVQDERLAAFLRSAGASESIVRRFAEHVCRGVGVGLRAGRGRKRDRQRQKRESKGEE